MATKLGTWTSPYTSPTFKYDIYADVISRGVGTATVRVIVDAYMTYSSSYFGYELEGRVTLDGHHVLTKDIVTPSTPLSGTTKRRVTYDITVDDVAAAGETCSLKFEGLRPGGEGTSGLITVNTSFAIGAYYLAPNAPTNAAVTRVSDTQHTVSWTRNATTDRPYTNLVLERWDNVSGAFAALATIAGTAKSYSDTSTRSDRRYQYRVKATNSAGSSSWATTVKIDTTPATPTGLVATKSTTDVTLAWTDVSTIEAGYEIWESLNGAAYALLDTAPAGATGYTHVAPDTAKTHRYKVRSKATTGGTLYSAFSVESALIQLLTAPNAPTQLSPSGVGRDGTDSLKFRWTHNPVDSTAQTAYELQYRPAGGSFTSTGSVSSVASEHTFAAGTFANGIVLEWQVRTKGQHADWSAWSALAAFNVSARPTCLITVPAVDDETITTSSLTVEWTYADAELTDQSKAVVRLRDEFGDVVAEWTVTGTAGELLLPVTLADGASMSVDVIVYDAHGVASLTASRTFSVAYLPPVEPELDAVFDVETGRTALMVTNPSPTSGEPEVAYNRIYRSLPDGTFELIDGAVPAGGAITDDTPQVGVPVTYRVEAVSVTPSVAVNDVEFVFDPDGRIYINAGSDVMVLQLRAAVAAKHARRRALEHYAGREKPVLYEGEHLARELTVSAMLFDLSYLPTVERVMDATGPKVYRDPYGRRIVCTTPDGYAIAHQRGRAYGFDATIVEVDA